MTTQILARVPFAIVRTFAALGLFLAASLGPAAAQDGAQLAVVAKDSTQGLSAYLQEKINTHGRPDYTKPPASQYLQHILDADAFAALPPPKATDIPWLLEWTASISQSYKMMLLFGATSDKDMKDTIVLNLTESEDAIMTAMALEVRFGSRMLTTMPLFMASLPPEDPKKTEIRKAGVKRAERGLVETVQGTSMTLSSAMRPNNALALAAALRDTAPVWAPLTTADERRQLLTLFKKASDANVYPGVVSALTTASATVSAVKN